VNGQPISVLVVDDSALMRNLVGRIVAASSELQLVGTAMNGAFALQKLEKLGPDVIVLDIEMPQMNGLQFLEERKRRGIDIPVVVLSSVADRGARITMDALALGASDFVTKPSGSESEDLHVIGEQLTHLLTSYGRQHQMRRRQLAQSVDKKPAADEGPASRALAPEPHSQPIVEYPDIPLPAQIDPADLDGAVDALIRDRRKANGRQTGLEALAIGISTGGPNALRKIFAELSADLGLAVVVVQHMPAGFTEEFARSLDRICALEVREAKEGDVARPGRVLIAPGNMHLTLERLPLGVVAHLGNEGAVNGHRPSADVLFHSVSEVYGSRTLAVIMTGMGRDGAQGIGVIKNKGGITLGQDAATSIVYGMPKVAYEKGFVQVQVPLPHMAGVINRLAAELRA